VLRAQENPQFSAAELGATVLSLEQQLDFHDRRHAAITAAVEELASSLTVEDLECPVCTTRFLHGELLALVAANRNRTQPNARELSNSLVSARGELASATSQVADLERQVQALLARRTAVEAVERRARELQEQIAELSSGRAINSLAQLEAVAGDLTAQLQALDVVLADSLSEDDLTSKAEETRVTRAEALARSAELRAERADLLNDAEKARSTLDQFPEVWNPDTGLAVPLDELRASAADDVVAATALLVSCDEAVNALSEQLEVHNREATEAASVRDTYLHRIEALARREAMLRVNWQELGMAGEPEIQAVWSERDRIGQVVLLLSSAQEQIDRAHRQYRNRLSDEELVECEQEVQQRMKAHGVEGDWETMSLQLRRAVLDAEQLTSRAQRAKERVDSVVRDLKQMANTYAQDVLQPLNDTIQEFAYVLLTRADGSLSFRSAHHANRSELRPGILRTDASGHPELLDLNPNFYFSEGQLSALSVSALLAASTTFRWSRWPALLMDDPLQHNDVIHASAFIDLLRRLVSQLGYQVILSSHDAAEADFIARKCRSAGIRYSYCELLPPGDAGIVSRSDILR
jgi:exonuclease SbcC